MWLRRKAKEIFYCEICKSPNVTRIGIWDYCPEGHTYVGERVDDAHSR